MPVGTTEIPFEIPLVPRPHQNILETYHGVFINIQYLLKCELKRSFLSKDVTNSLEFIVEYKKVFIINFFAIRLPIRTRN